MGNKRGQAYPLMNHLAERGWVCASMSYRLAPAHPWPAHIVDVKLAIAWLRQHAHEFGGDPDFVVVTGGSAGGHLAALAALSPNDPAFQPGFEQVDTAVAAAVPLYGRYDFFSREGEGRREFMYFLERVVVQDWARRRPDVFKAASPIWREADMPEAAPFLIVHGDRDSLIPVEQARAFALKLRTHSRQAVAYAELPGAQHAFDFIASRRTKDVCEAIGGFLGVVLGEHRARRDHIAAASEGV
jgi:acetyl esterase/lipase